MALYSSREYSPWYHYGLCFYYFENYALMKTHRLYRTPFRGEIKVVTCINTYYDLLL